MRVFLCEKPSQGKDIAPHVGARQPGKGCITGPGVVVTWCIGHLLEQAPPEHYDANLKSWNVDLLPICPSEWTLSVVQKTADQFKVVQQILRSATEVVIATDADREGEVIARSVLEQLSYRGPLKRLWLSALDSASIRKGLANLLPGVSKLSLYYSGLGRAHADWLAGMNLTMALTSLFGGSGRGGVLHCGRVQTQVLTLIVRLERKIAIFKPKTYYVLAASFEMRGTVVPMDWHVNSSKLDADGHCLDKAYVESVAQKISGKAGRLTQVTTTPERELAPLLFSLGRLQQEANRRYGLKAQAVLDACQALYEKYKATTYPRTDCEHLPNSMFPDAGNVLGAISKIDPSLDRLVKMADLSKSGRAFNDKKITAHHAIIPTGNAHVRMSEMTRNEQLVYDLIRRRYLAQFLGDFLFNKTVIQLACEAETFTKTGTMPTSLGWKRVNEGMEQPKKAANPQTASAGTDEGESGQESVTLPSVQVGDQAINRLAKAVPTKTKPPKRYTEASLLAAMDAIDKIIDDPRLKKIMLTKEKAGIGTDATRSGIIEGLFKRAYIDNDKKQIIPTEKGNSLIEIIEKVAPELADPVLTAVWEDQLMQIEAGSLTVVKFESTLGDWLRKVIDGMRKEALSRPVRASAAVSSGGTRANDSPVHLCECGKSMRLRNGANGAFWGCSGYPACRNTLPDDHGQPGQRNVASSGTAAKQENKPSNREIPVKATTPLGFARGPTVARSGVPGGQGLGPTNVGRETEQTKRQESQGPTASMTCQCGRAMTLRNGARGPFYGCTGYPACRGTASAEGVKTI